MSRRMLIMGDGIFNKFKNRITTIIAVESVDKSVSIADRSDLSTFDKHLLFLLISLLNL